MTDGLPRARAHSGLKGAIRRAIRHGIQEYDGMAFDDEVNTITNRIYKGVVRPAMARVFADGFAQGAECCGCCGARRKNPYDVEEE